MIETCRLKRFVIFFQKNLTFVLSEKLRVINPNPGEVIRGFFEDDRE